jgi:hypothetical protein
LLGYQFLLLFSCGLEQTHLSTFGGNIEGEPCYILLHDLHFFGLLQLPFLYVFKLLGDLFLFIGFKDF